MAYCRFYENVRFIPHSEWHVPRADKISQALAAKVQYASGDPNGVVKGNSVVHHPAISGTAQLSLYDMAGKLIKIQQVPAHTSQTKLDLKSFTAGAYKIVWTNGSIVVSQTII
ncbi:MAG: T9SS type A sorting domain-containing protein, partial [Chitinophagaceae bacterium]